ncbi:putative reverse transcriptase zinc-binding domain-containing protein [Rosa chinensis]|uniref:Putative reverse transcriptase zinc-binding domain-containing protein n=1 Tax=Rosa chinensis TaxID=74649 RepID=A0A2P6SPY3_ROSCH|nr:putative reverse transcriptase zinc-binding domain-containing protein [Rosa chinensis]
MNQAMLAKAGWRLFQNNSGLWATVYKDKYLSHDNLFYANYQIPKDCSSTWRSVVHGASLLKQGLTWRVGDGKRIKFWIHIWLPPLALINYIHHDVEIEINATICSFWNENGWNINFLYSYFPDDIVSRILHTPPGFDGCGEDIQIWNYTTNGDFSVKSAHNIFFDTYDQHHSPWKFIWKMHIPPKLKTFTWVLCHGKLLTNVQRVRRHFSFDDSCPLCHSASESLVHLFRDYPCVQNFEHKGFKIFGILSLYLTLFFVPRTCIGMLG